MKKYFLLFILFPLTIIPVFCKWVPVDDASTTIRFTGIRCTDSMNCIAIGNQGLMQPWNRVTRDGGITWETTLRDTVIGHYTPYRVIDVAFPDTNLCIALCEHDYFWRSTDNCRTWVKHSLETTNLCFDVNFLNENYGCIITWRDLFLTNDGGLNWEKTTFPDTTKLYGLYKIQIIDTSTIFMITYDSNYVYYFTKRENKGQSWNSVNFRKGIFLTSISFIDKFNGWISGVYKPVPNKYQGFILHTSDGGKNWETQLDTFNYPYYGLNKIKFADSLTGFALGYFREMWKTKDGGKKWVRDTSYNSNSVPDDYFADVDFMTPSKLIGAATMIRKIYIYEDDIVGVEESGFPLIESDFSIYPNPVITSGDFNIKFNLNYPSTVKLNIYNSSGEKIELSYESSFSEGNHTIKYNPERKLSSGIYFLKLEIGKKTEIKHIVLLD